jgi:IclR family transcriptional regulator, KDG regulon repressor
MANSMKRIKSIARAIRILEAFQDGEGFTVSELGRSIKAPKSSVHEILSTLVAEGVLIKDSTSNIYRIGVKLLELASYARRSLAVSREATPVLEALNQLFNETVQLTILDGDEILYVGGFESTRQLRTFFKLGERAPLHCTALGKAIMAFLPAEESDAIVARNGLARFTRNTIVDKRQLRRELAATAARGFAVDNVEHEEGVRCVAAPIRNHEGRVVASVSVSGPSQRLPPDRDAVIAARVIAAANEISRRLGYRRTEPALERR